MNALQKLVARGSTNVSVLLRAQHQASMPLAATSIAASATGLVVKYHRLGDATEAAATGVSLALTSIAGLTVAHTDGAVQAVWDGYVRVDVPDAAFANAAGVNDVLVTAQATGVIFAGALVQLTDGGQISATTPQRY